GGAGSSGGPPGRGGGSGSSGGIGGGCTSCSGGMGDEPVFGSESAAVRSVHQAWHLGTASPKDSAGILMISEQTADTNLCTPSKLQYLGNTNLVTVVRDGSDVIQRIDAPQGRIMVTNVQTYRYDLE